jgi:sugar phosphate permease
MLEKIRVGVALTFILLFTVSVFTQFPTDSGTRTILGTLALAAAGFLFGPTLLRGGKNANGK